MNRSHFPKYVLKKVDLDNLVDPDSSNPDENLRPIEKELGTVQGVPIKYVFSPPQTKNWLTNLENVLYVDRLFVHSFCNVLCSSVPKF